MINHVLGHRGHVNIQKKIDRFQTFVNVIFKLNYGLSIHKHNTQAGLT